MGTLTLDETPVNGFIPRERSTFEIRCDKCAFLATLNVDDIDAAEGIRDLHSDGHVGHRAYCLRNVTHLLVSTSLNRGAIASETSQ